MNHLEMALAARAYAEGRGIRSALFRHRRLVQDPIAVVAWQLGAEPFSASALGWGDRADDLHIGVAGEPRNRDLAFALLLRFARWFNPRFEQQRAEAPQIVVANGATADLLGRLGRRLAYLPTEGVRPAPPELVRLGRHLLFLWDRRATPGQQMLLAMTDLMQSHWVTAQSQPERQSLPALDAHVSPSPGLTCFEAAALAERQSVGPAPAGEDDQRLAPLLEQFNRLRAGETSQEAVAPLLGPIEAHYRPLIERAWRLLWRCRDREAAFPEAPSAARRWAEDRTAHEGHLEWLAAGGKRRTRHTPRQAAVVLRNLEEAKRRVEAEEATDDALRMVPYLLAQKAVDGRVIAVDAQHTEIGGNGRKVRRPLVKLLTSDPCLIPTGRELWWSASPAGREYVVQSVIATEGGETVTLKLMTGSASARLPAVGDDATFSIHSTAPRWLASLPRDTPWPHRPGEPPQPADIEDEPQGDQP